MRLYLINSQLAQEYKPAVGAGMRRCSLCLASCALLTILQNLLPHQSNRTRVRRNESSIEITKAGFIKIF